MKIYQGEELPEPKSMLEVSYSFLNIVYVMMYCPIVINITILSSEHVANVYW